MKSKKVLTTPSNDTSEVENRELIYSKEELEPFTGQPEDGTGHDSVVGRDWGVSSKDDG